MLQQPAPPDRLGIRLPVSLTVGTIGREMAETTKAHCNGCLGERNHEILHAYKDHWRDEETSFSGSDQYELLKCRGCERITLRHISWFSGDHEPTIRYYPPSIFRSRPPWFNELLSLGAYTIYQGYSSGKSTSACKMEPPDSPRWASGHFLNSS